MDIVRIIEKIGINGARWIEEHVDLQFKALQFLHEHIHDKDIFVPLVVANALVSYQLSGKGEEWWWEFAHWFSEHDVVSIPEAYAEFLPQSETNRRLTNVKVRRLEKAERFLERMDIDRYYENMVKLQYGLADVMGTKRNAKTVVFAVKMFGYATRIATGEFRPYPMEIPIPVDSRIERITKRLTDENPIRFWNRIAEETDVPPLHIDSVLWPAMSGRPEIREKIRGKFGKTGEKLIQILSP